MITIEGVIWYFVVLDALIGNAIAWFDKKWYKKKFKIFSGWFPISKGWMAYYVLLVLWIGVLLWQLGLLF